MSTLSEAHSYHPAAGPGSPEDNGGHHPWSVSYEDREFEALAPKLIACLAAGRTAYLAKLAEVGDVGTSGFGNVTIEITPETKPAIRWLNEESGAGKIRQVFVNCYTRATKTLPNQTLNSQARLMVVVNHLGSGTYQHVAN